MRTSLLPLVHSNEGNGRYHGRRGVVSAQPVRRGAAPIPYGGRVVASATVRRGIEPHPSKASPVAPPLPCIWQKSNSLCSLTAKANKRLGRMIPLLEIQQRTVHSPSGDSGRPVCTPNRKPILESDLLCLSEALKNIQEVRRNPYGVSELLKDWREASGVVQKKMEKSSNNTIATVTPQRKKNAGPSRIEPGSIQVTMLTLCGAALAYTATETIVAARVTKVQEESLVILIRGLRARLHTETAAAAAALLVLASTNAGLSRLPSEEETHAIIVMCGAIASARVVGDRRKAEERELERERMRVGVEQVVEMVESPPPTPAPLVVVSRVVKEAQQPKEKRRPSATQRRGSAARVIPRYSSARTTASSASAPTQTARRRDPSDRRRIREKRRAARLEQWERAISAMDIPTLKLYVASLNGQFGPEHYSALLRLSMEDVVVKPGASSKEMAALKSRVAEEADCTASCVICLDKYETGEVMAVLPVCSHVFHEACALEYFESYGRSCPICKAKLGPVSPTGSQVALSEGG